MRPWVSLVTLTGLVLVLEPRSVTAQSCTAPAFTPPSGPRIVPTTVIQPGDVAVGDFNHDGRLDFVVTDSQNPTLEVFLQTPLPAPPGTWSSAGTVGTGGLPTSVTVADVNRDGRQDVLVSTNDSTQGRVYLGNGAGGMTLSAMLTSMAGSTTATDIAVLDVDRDGILDVVIADISPPPAPAINIGLYAFRGNGNGTFQASVKFAPQDFGSLAIADLDRDGRDDLALTEASNVSPALLTATLTGDFFSPFFSASFGIGVGNNPLPQFNTVATGDFDNDGLHDVAVADSTRVQIFLGLGTGQVNPAGQFLLVGGALSLQAGDVNLDGNLDLVFITPFPTGSVGMMLGNGAGAFSPPTLTTFPTTADGVAVALGDFNADGRLDIAAANKVGRTVAILLNELESTCPGASFGPAARGFLASDPRALATGDFNNDGVRDVVAASTSENEVTVLRGATSAAVPGPPTFAPGFSATSLTGLSTPRGVVLGRFNADAFLDLAVANAGTGLVSVFQGGAVGFSFLGTVAVGAAPVALGTGDFNNDNRQDLAVVNQSANNVSIRLGNGDGTFVGAPDVAVGPTPSAVAIADFNQDGRPDLAVTNFGVNTVSIRLGAGGGTFTASSDPAVGSNPNSLAVGDFNQDGRPDLVVSNQSSTSLSILLGNGDGTFSLGVTLSAGTPPIAVVVTRLNGDALPDIAVAVSSPIDSVRTFLATGLGTFGTPTDYYVGPDLQSLADGDFTKDGKPDLVAGRSVGTQGHLEILVSLGTGALAQAPNASTGGNGPIVVVADDFDRDGDEDLFFANETSNAMRFHANNGAGVFTAAAASINISPQPRVLAAADFNRDGKKDVAVAFASNNVRILKGDGLGGFTIFTPPSPPHVAQDLAVADFDLDGDVDLVLADTSTAVARIYLGDGSGGFTGSVNLLTPALVQQLVVGDFDGNGRPDVVAACQGTSQLSVFLNAYDFTPPLLATDFVTVNPGAGVIPSLLAAGDFNADGRLDLATNTPFGAQVLLGNGAGQFPTSRPIDLDNNTVSRLRAADVNNDGTVDVVAALGSLNLVSVHLWNKGIDGLVDPVFYAPATPGAAPGGIAIADYDGDGKLDLAVANAGSHSYSIYRNTNCTSRRLAIVTEVSTCNVPNVAFSTQPRVGIFDDAGYLSRCEASPVTASIAPGTGTAGAVLGPPPLFVAPSLGIASFNNLGIDLPGQRYRLGYSHPAGSAMSRPFSQGLTATISGGPTELCIGQTATFFTAAGFDSYAWTVDPPATPVSFLPNVTLSGLGVGPHTLELLVTQEGCSAIDTESPNVNPNLSNVTVSTPGPTTVCTTCVGGTVTESHVGGGAITGHQWMFGTASGGPYPNFIPAQGGSTYVINGADFPGPGTYYLVTRTLPTCGPASTSTNEVVVQVQTAVPGDTVRFFTVTTSGTTNTLEWVNPPGRDTVRIRRLSGASSCVFPSDPNGSDGSFFTGDHVGPLGGRDSFVDPGPLALNTKYCYTAWVNLGGPFGPGRSNSGRTFLTPGPVQWAFNIGTLALVPPGNGIGVMHMVAMDNSLHTVTKGPGGGTWPTSPFVWMPQEMNGPSQGRPAGIPFTAGGATKLMFLGDQAGFVHAFNEDTGDQVWVTAPALGDRVVAGASGIFKVFGGFENMVLAATYNSSSLTGNVLYALNPANGNVLWSYNGNDMVVDHGLIGIISGQPAVDYAAKRVYFASRAFGGVPDNNTLWCVNLADGTSCWAKSYGDIETGVSLQEDRLLVGTNAGTVLALKKSDGDPAWGAPLSTGDGRVRGYIASDRLTGDIYFSTNSMVWRVEAGGASASTIWSVPFTAPSTPVFAPGDTVVYVGGAGSLFQLNVVGGGVFGSFLLGDGTSKVGSPTLDLRNGFAYVGTEAGIVYAVRIP